jgi:hypothetical protein
VEMTQSMNAVIHHYHFLIATVLVMIDCHLYFTPRRKGSS